MYVAFSADVNVLYHETIRQIGVSGRLGVLEVPRFKISLYNINPFDEPFSQDGVIHLLISDGTNFSHSLMSETALRPNQFEWCADC